MGATMENAWLHSEVLVRLGVFASVFALMALWEVLAPRRHPIATRRQRWPSNLGIVVLNTLLLRLLFPVTAVGLAMFAQQHQWGALHHTALPVWVQVTMAFVLLDLAIYLQHRLFHIVPMFWRLHRMHHADTEFDLTRLLAQRERMVELGRSCVHADLPMMMRIKDLPPRYLKHFSAKLAVAEASL